MSLDWLTWSNPVAVWWCCLAAISAVNIALWLKLQAHASQSAIRTSTGILAIEPLMLLAAVYVFGCAFRSILPRADVQRICLFDTWLSSVHGRPLGRHRRRALFRRAMGDRAARARQDQRIPIPTKNIANAIVPLIVLAECCSWYAVISTNFFGNVLENSIWTVTFVADRESRCCGSRELPRPGSQLPSRRRPLGVAGYVVVHVDRRRADVFRALAGGTRGRQATISACSPGLHDSPRAGS